MAAPTPAAEMLIGRFRLIEELAEGGQAVVWRAEDTVIRQPVVLKLLRQGLVDSADARRRLLREIEAARLLDHPNIPTTFGSGEWEGGIYVAYRLIEGETLSALAARSRVAIDEAARIVIAAARALGHAHSRGVVHRDVSGRNVMVDHTGQVYVIDFGIALLVDRTRFTDPDHALMTPAYVSPEVARGFDADPRSDLYGLGVVFYELVTGTLPFRSPHPQAQIYAAAYEPPPPPSERRVELPSWVDRFVLKALAKRGEDRYQDADALIADLRAAAVADGVGTAVAPPRPSLGRRAVAVLPFRDLTDAADGHGASEALTRGLTEAVTVSLARAPEIEVIVPESPDPARAETLGARFLVTGSLRRAGPRVRLTYGVTDLATRKQIAGDTLDGMADDVFDLEDRLTEKLLRMLEVRDASPRRRATRNPASHQHYLEALGYLQRFEDQASVDHAIRLLEELIAADGDSARALAVLARAYVRKYEITLEQRWEMQAAEACGRALDLDPDDPEALVTLGEVHNSVGRHADAILSFRLAIEGRHDLAEGWLGLALANERLARFDEAEAAARQAIAVQPSGWKGYNRLGIVFYRQGRYAQAIEPWRTVTRLAPDNPRGHEHVGAACFSLNRFEDALVAYRRSVELRPNAMAWSGIGTVQYYLGQFDAAARAFETAAALKPNDSRLWGFLGSTLHLTADGAAQARAAFDRAIALGRERVDINPNFAEEWVWLGCWYAELGDHTRARESLSRALAVGREDVSVLAQAGIGYELLGDRASALRWIDEAVRRGYGLQRLTQDPGLASLQEDPGFRRIAENPPAPADGSLDRQ